MATTFAVPDGRVAMAATLYTGNGSYPRTIANTVNTVSFQPDFVWVKARNQAYGNILYDSVRGPGATKSLTSQNTDVEGASSANTNLSAFASTGFTVDTTSSVNVLNENATTFVGWQWKAGGTAVSNIEGTITSSVSANTTAGFSVVTYTGTGATGTVGHGLGVAPSLIIVKARSSAAPWPVYSVTLGISQYLELSSNIAAGSISNYWGASSPTSTVFGLPNASFNNNISAATYVAYCWAPIAGYSAFGSYTGNGSADGPFIYTGFRPRYFLTKRTDLAGTRWIVMDTSRNLTNVADLTLAPNASNAELNNSPYWLLDFLSNGFKIRGYQSGDSEWNVPGANFIYAAFAENPLKYANAR
jgi:hypothetical protein